MVASNRLSAHEGHTLAIPDSEERVLRAGVLYGANGAGKSNLVKALAYVRSLARSARVRGDVTGREAFRLGSIENEPTGFDLQFIAGQRLYRFGVKVDDRRISEEWLVRVVGGSETILYERLTDVEVPQCGKKLKALATVGAPDNQTFLATMAANLDEADLGDDIPRVLKWFSDGFKLIAPSNSYRALAGALERAPDLLDFTGEYLRTASTGIDALKAARHEITEQEFRQLVPGDLPQVSNGQPVLLSLRMGDALLVERNGRNRYYQLGVRAVHRGENGEPVIFDLLEESDGTRRLLELIPAVHRASRDNSVFVIDEIDRSLHPLLARGFLKSFLDACAGSQSQLIVTTHESSLLDQDLLRRDEIWFAEKDQASATHLYSLVDFKVRNDLEIRKHYLQGRFGAIPFVGGLERLKDE